MLPWLAGAAAAGPWVHDPGSWYVKAAYGELRVAPSPMAHLARSGWTYAEVGLFDGVQLVAELPWVSASNRWPGSELSYTTAGLGSLRAGLGLAPPGGVPVSLHAIGRVPLFGHEIGASLAPPLGDEQVDLDLLLAGGASAPVATWPVWGLVEAGVRVRTGLTLSRGVRTADFDEAALYRVQLGVLPRVAGRDLGWVQVEADGVLDLGDREQVHALGGGVAVAIVRSLHLEVGLAHLGATGGQGWRWSAGLSHRRQP